MLLFLSSTILEAFPPITFLKPNRFHTAFNIIYPTRKNIYLPYPIHLPYLLSCLLLYVRQHTNQCTHLQIHPSILYLYSIPHCSNICKILPGEVAQKISWMYIWDREKQNLFSRPSFEIWFIDVLWAYNYIKTPNLTIWHLTKIVFIFIWFNILAITISRKKSTWEYA